MGPVFGYKHDFFTFDGSADILSEKPHGNRNSFALEGQPLINAARIPKSQDNWRLEVLRIGSNDPAAGELDAAWQKGVSWSPEVSQHLNSVLPETALEAPCPDIDALIWPVVTDSWLLHGL